MPFFRGNQFTSVFHSAVLFVCSVLDHRHDPVKIFKKNIPDLTSQRGVFSLNFDILRALTLNRHTV